MIRFAVAGTRDYLEKVEYLKQNGYTAQLVIGDKIENHLEEIKELKIELLVCLAHPDILRKNILGIFSKGCINYHYGLPKYQGRHPLNWMIIDGIREIPAAIHYMTEGIDTGDIITQDTILVEREDDYTTLSRKLNILGSELLLHAIKQIESGSVYRCKQIKELINYTRKRKPEDSKINWNKTSQQLIRFINALVDPMPNAFGSINSEQVLFKRSIVGSGIGKVLAETTDGNYVISTMDGVILVECDKKLKQGMTFDTI